MALQEKCNNLEHVVECDGYIYSRSTCLAITNIRCEKDETTDNEVNEVGVDIPDSNIDIAHQIERIKDKKQAVIVKFTTFRHHTLLFRARRKRKNIVKLDVDLS